MKLIQEENKISEPDTFDNFVPMEASSYDTFVFGQESENETPIIQDPGSSDFDTFDIGKKPTSASINEEENDVDTFNIENKNNPKEKSTEEGNKYDDLFVPIEEAMKYDTFDIKSEEPSLEEEKAREAPTKEEVFETSEEQENDTLLREKEKDDEDIENTMQSSSLKEVWNEVSQEEDEKIDQESHLQKEKSEIDLTEPPLKEDPLDLPEESESKAEEEIEEEKIWNEINGLIDLESNSTEEDSIPEENIEKEESTLEEAENKEKEPPLFTALESLENSMSMKEAKESVDIEESEPADIDIIKKSETEDSELVPTKQKKESTIELENLDLEPLEETMILDTPSLILEEEPQIKVEDLNQEEPVSTDTIETEGKEEDTLGETVDLTPALLEELRLTSKEPEMVALEAVTPLEEGTVEEEIQKEEIEAPTESIPTKEEFKVQEVKATEEKGVEPAIMKENDEEDRESVQIDPAIAEKINQIEAKNNTFGVGKIVNMKEFIIEVVGLEDVSFYEKINIANKATGYVTKIETNSVYIALLDKKEDLIIGDSVYQTNEEFTGSFSEDALGRIINLFGVDELTDKKFTNQEKIRIEEDNIPIMDRTAVNRPLLTGIAGIDLIYPIGRGQRQLIIGDKKTGKTQICLDTIANQQGKNMICIYCAIGKTKKEVKEIYQDLLKKGAMAYTIIITAFNDDTVPVLVLTPFYALSVAKRYMEKGYDVLVVLDDLKRHGDAYREISLISGKSPGRDAYPSDIFYLHSRLLEKGCQYKNGASITILPVVETRGGDITDYISTNIISITDGQIVLSAKNFQKGEKPAINYGLSVSRLGGAVQTKEMKSLGAQVRRRLLSYLDTREVYELANIDEMSPELQAKIFEGKKILEQLIQPKYSPKSEEEIKQKFAFLGEKQNG